MAEIEKEYIYAELTYPKPIADKLLPQIRARLYAYMEYVAFIINNNAIPTKILEFINPVLLEYFKTIFLPFYGIDVPKDTKKFTELRKFYTKFNQEATDNIQKDSSSPPLHHQKSE